MIPIGAILFVVGIGYFLGALWSLLSIVIVILLLPLWIFRSWLSARRARVNVRQTGNPWGIIGYKGHRLDEHGIPLLDDEDDDCSDENCGCGHTMDQIKKVPR